MKKAFKIKLKLNIIWITFDLRCREETPDNTESRSFVSVADFGIRSFDKNLLERKVKGRLEIKKLRSGDDFTLYLMGASGSWYFFKYQKGIMGILASDPVFNEMIKANIDKMSSDDYKLRQGSISDRNKLVRALKGKL